MDQKTELLFREISILSKNVFISVIIVGLFVFLLSMIQIGWLTLICVILWFFVIIVSLVTPIIFIVLGKPSLAQAWLLGINQIYVPADPWSELTTGQKLSVYFYSMLFSVVAIGALIGTLIQVFQK